MSVQNVKRILLGTPIPTAHAAHERLGPLTGLAIFASDALSSVAYATEEILLILMLAGSAALGLSFPIAVAIGVLIAIVVSSYRQTILAYPQGGGSYIVTRENLGRYPSLVAGAALMVDYVLTVAVSVAAGIAAITSAIRPLYPYRVTLCVIGVAVIAIGNLRGVRESGRLFALPTYLFLGAYFLLIGWGGLQWLRGAAGAAVPPVPAGGGEVLTAFLILRAFSSGCAAMTGIEAVSDGVPAFRPPEAQTARRVLLALGGILIVLFLGISALAHAFGVVPVDGETVNSQLARLVFGESPLYYFIQGVTMLILVLAANTSFADFPRLASFLARDRFIPRQFANRGDRLAFSNGIIILALLSIGLRGGLPGEHACADPALRAGRVRLLHALAGQHGALLVPAPATGLADPRPPQRDGRARHRRGGGDHRADEVHARGVDRRRPAPVHDRPVRHDPTALRRGGPPALGGGRGAPPSAGRARGPRAGGRRPPGHAAGHRVRSVAVSEPRAVSTSRWTRSRRAGSRSGGPSTRRGCRWSCCAHPTAR